MVYYLFTLSINLPIKAFFYFVMNRSGTHITVRVQTIVPNVINKVLKESGSAHKFVWTVICKIKYRHLYPHSWLTNIRGLILPNIYNNFVLLKPLR